MSKRIVTAATGATLLAAGCATATKTVGPAQPATMTAPATQPATMSCPSIYAHQGAQYERPGNTTASFTRANELGVGSEMDVQASKDGMLLIMHDGKVDRTTNGTGYVAQLDWSYLSTLLATNYAPWNTSAWKDEHIPTLDEALAAAGANGQPVLLDMHFMPNKEQFDRIWYELSTHGMTNRVTILSNPRLLGLVHMWYPTLDTEIIEYPPAGYIRSAESAMTYGATYGLPSRDLTGQLVAYYHASDLKVSSWTSDSPAEDNEAVWARLVGWGVDSITTGHPAELLAWEARNCTKSKRATFGPSSTSSIRDDDAKYSKH